MLTVKDIYIGKPDAKDEIISQKSDEFLKSFVIPPNFKFEDLIDGDKIFISGYKGTGKTALLLYLDAKCKEINEMTCSSFILFKTQYGNVQKLGLQNISKNIIKTIGIDKDTLENETDFEYIWKWIIFKQIIDDNKENNGAIFKENSNWNKFTKIIGSIMSDKSTRSFFKMPNKVRLGLGYSFSNGDSTSTLNPELELNFNNNDNIEIYTKFISLIDLAEDVFCSLERTDIPYYIFVDELEAFYADNDILKRDLTMIRDLIITIKNINSLFISNGFKNTKIICSIRTEIVNSILRFIPTKEINKIISGYECPLVWNYSNTNSYVHPIFKIWLKRIELSENNVGNYFKSDKEIYEKWFCSEISGISTVTYVLNNTWNKPRDIVRFLNATKSTLYSDRNVYTPAIFHSCLKEYSQESLNEIKEELNALYTPQELQEIFMCLNGYKPYFSYEELKERIDKYFEDTVFKYKMRDILNDLYRLGIIGNYSKSSNQYRWQHKSNDGIIFDDEWDITVHKALWKTLSLNEKHGKVARLIEENNSKDLYGKIVECIVEKVIPGFVMVTFYVEEERFYGSIHISELADKYIKNIFEYVKVGEVFDAKVLEYDKKHLKWKLTCRY